MKITSFQMRDIQPGPPYRTKGRAYFFPVLESVIDNMMNRRNRPHTEYKKLLLELFKKEGIKNVKVSWSQKAGCSCGCSPGFIMTGLDKDIYIDVK